MTLILNTPSKIADAINHNLMRVVYYDGQIADFLIVAWPSTIPLQSKTKVASINIQDYSLADRADAIDAMPCGALYAIIPVDYWGTISFESGNSNDPSDLGATIGGWIDMGTMELGVPGGKFCR